MTIEGIDPETMEQIRLARQRLERPNRISCPVIACFWGSETPGAMAAHLAAQHPGYQSPTVAGYGLVADAAKREVARGILSESQRAAPGKMFSRETICAIIRGQMAITHDSHLRDLLNIFERLE